MTPRRTRAATRRLFFALCPDEAGRAALAASAATAVAASDGRAVAVAQLHVTLAFLGSVAVTRIPELTALARALAAGWPPGAAPIALTFTRLAFWHRPQVLCALARPTAAASRLATVLRDATHAAGFRPDLKPFRAHVTVARKVTHARSAALASVRWRCAALALMESRSAPGGSLYSVVESAPLGKPR